jgi:oxygen-dependent protoporphyrinogen oxidase
MEMIPRRIAVLGGGVTGLAAAYRLTRLGHEVRLFERSSQVGGALATEREGGWLVEKGPNSLQDTPIVASLVRELGLKAECIVADPAAKNRYVVRGGQLQAIPLSPSALLLSRLFSTRTKLRLLTECFTRPPVRPSDVSVADFVRGHFGSEVLDYVFQPLISGIYAGDPSRLSAREAFPRWWDLERTYGSLVLGQLATARERDERGEPPAPGLISFRNGLQTLSETLASRLSATTLVLNTTIESLRPGPRWRVGVRDRDGSTREETFDAVVSALSAPALAKLPFGSAGERPFSFLGAVPHAPVASLFLGFRREQVRHSLAGFGVLVPAVEKRGFLGAIFSSSLFPGRAPEGHVAITVLAGGILQPAVAALTADELWAHVRGDLGTLLGIEGEPVFCRHTYWSEGIPQYNLGHDRMLAGIAAFAHSYPSLWIAGNFRYGISVPDCLQSGMRRAENVGRLP